ncbi:hypothetical protein [Wielerella bovis]|uniref:hypothetical protein n=1 Tax=Wielerella bovis TaxID=2917790 RepID=UPI0020191BA9|nr:hypothetical protein [Wielerella bovis]ULJ63953.1 hypothetical protein MIS33_07205 [Wielerella bovis]ULJ68066.1 hypothetical protein MIS31_05930 [Wielerella bovis]
MKKLFVLSAALMLAACGSNELSQSDVQKAVSASAKHNAVCVPFTLNVEHRHESDNPQDSQLGASELRLLKRLDNGKRANLAAMKQMESFVDAGLYRQEKNLRVGEGEKAVRYLVYSLTDKGRKTFIPSPHGHLMCIGHEEVSKINYFTEPTPANGVTITQVSYEAKIVPERWAKRLLKNSPYYEGLKQTEEKRITLVKTNDGWRNILDLRNKAE